MLPYEEAKKNLLSGGLTGNDLTSAQKSLENAYLKKSPVASISTDSAISTLNRSQEKLNQISPTTAPGYVAPAPVKETKGTLPKAYFVNDQGQEAEYNEAQLKDPATRDFIEKGGYVMNKTEGPSLIAGELDNTNKQIQNLVQEFNSWNVDNDPAFQSIAGDIRRKYDALEAKMTETNKSRAGALQTMGIRGGTTRYAGQIQLGIEGEELSQANQRMADLLSEEASAITEARSAYQTGKWGLYNAKISALDKIRENKTKELVAYNEKLDAATKKFNETVGQASRDGAIGGLIEQGITDPTQILNYLNYDDNGNQIGDFTASEIEKTLKSLVPDTKDWQDKLSGTTRDFYILKGQGLLPGSISSLPEDQQMFAYLKQEKVASSVGTGSGTKNPITLAEAKSLGLPISTVGMSQDEILDTLQTSIAPDWFIEKVQNELKMNLTPEAASKAWDEYRNGVMDTAEGKKEEKEPADAESYKKSKQYFSATYDGLTDDQVDQIATAVETYVNGGMSYADAVAQTIKDIE